jgi:hypothetical protein
MGEPDYQANRVLLLYVTSLGERIVRHAYKNIPLIYIVKLNLVFILLSLLITHRLARLDECGARGWRRD